MDDASGGSLALSLSLATPERVKVISADQADQMIGSARAELRRLERLLAQVEQEADRLEREAHERGGDPQLLGRTATEVESFIEARQTVAQHERQLIIQQATDKARARLDQAEADSRTPASTARHSTAEVGAAAHPDIDQLAPDTAGSTDDDKAVVDASGAADIDVSEVAIEALVAPRQTRHRTAIGVVSSRPQFEFRRAAPRSDRPAGGLSPADSELVDSTPPADSVKSRRPTSTAAKVGDAERNQVPLAGTGAHSDSVPPIVSIGDPQSDVESDAVVAASDGLRQPDRGGLPRRLGTIPVMALVQVVALLAVLVVLLTIIR